MNIILFDDLQPDPSGDYRIERGDVRYEHIVKVLRLQDGDRFQMGIVNGPSGTGSIIDADRERIHYAYREERPPGTGLPVRLLVGAVRPICMKRILREASSIGVGEILVTSTALGERSYLNATIWQEQRYRRFLLDGAQQAGTTTIPRLQRFHRLNQALDEISEQERIILDVGSGIPRLSELDLDSPAVLAVGTERGWSSEERRLFDERGWKRTSLGSRILRTETACSGGLVLLLARMGLI